MEEALRKRGQALFSLETHHDLSDFDVLGFTLQYDLTYSNVLNMLDLSRIPLLATERDADDPLVIAGGSCTYNPEPMADFVDAFAIGEGEAMILAILDVVRDWRFADKAGGRAALLAKLATLDGVYVPSLYEALPDERGVLAKVLPLGDAVPARARKQIMPTLPPAPRRPLSASH